MIRCGKALRLLCHRRENSYLSRERKRQASPLNSAGGCRLFYKVYFAERALRMQKRLLPGVESFSEISEHKKQRRAVKSSKKGSLCAAEAGKNI